MDATTLPQQTVLVEWTAQRLTFRNFKRQLVSVQFPGPHGGGRVGRSGHRNFQVVCAIAIAQSESTEGNRTSTWTGLSEGTFSLLQRRFGWQKLAFKTLTAYWSDFKRGNRARTTIRIDNAKPNDQGEMAEELFQATTSGGYVLGKPELEPPDRHRFWEIRFTGQENDPDYEELRAAVLEVLLGHTEILRRSTPHARDEIPCKFKPDEFAVLDLLGVGVSLAEVYQEPVGLRQVSDSVSPSTEGAVPAWEPARRLSDVRASYLSRRPPSGIGAPSAVPDSHEIESSSAADDVGDAPGRVTSAPVTLERIFSAWRLVVPHSLYEIPHIMMIGTSAGCRTE